ncbi:MAG: tRNA (5-methylaminomethyl-2-thiouridine)(34)-methyltransferase MnmD [Bacteroidia bacterium]|nr:tRNA (5-methylaminomethyl-2-thiouridine)(34)-methyltransferase MnmD [Bacteroidia bacterium]
MEEKKEIRHVISKDGSSTLYAPRFDEHYHSIHGAIQESMHVFINAGLRALEKEELRLLEMGLGTGLNAVLTAIHMDDRKIQYTGIEAFPVAEDLLTQLNYPKELGGDAETIFKKLHAMPWNEKGELIPAFVLEKIQGKLEEFDPESSYDLVYFDAFAPSAQLELWSLDIFQKMFGLMNPGAVLVTYCAKGDVRRAMIAAGFRVEKIPGPPGKREMLRAWKD